MQRPARRPETPAENSQPRNNEPPNIDELIEAALKPDSKPPAPDAPTGGASDKPRMSRLAAQICTAGLKALRKVPAGVQTGAEDGAGEPPGAMVHEPVPPVLPSSLGQASQKVHAMTARAENVLKTTVIIPQGIITRRIDSAKRALRRIVISIAVLFGLLIAFVIYSAWTAMPDQYPASPYSSAGTYPALAPETPAPSESTVPADRAGAGVVHVKGYYRKDGTFVQPHTRRKAR